MRTIRWNKKGKWANKIMKKTWIVLRNILLNIVAAFVVWTIISNSMTAYERTNTYQLGNWLRLMVGTCTFIQRVKAIIQ